MSDLIAWLRAQLDEDERVARAAQLQPPIPSWRESENLVYDADVPDDNTALQVAQSDWDEVAEHIARHDPARVLAEVAAKRKILDGHALDTHWCPMGDALLLALAQPYAGRPGWREEWRA